MLLIFKGHGIRNSVNTQNWAEFIGQHKGIERCITNGKGPSKFQNCRRWTIFILETNKVSVFMIIIKKK